MKLQIFALLFLWKTTFNENYYFIQFLYISKIFHILLKAFLLRSPVYVSYFPQVLLSVHICLLIYFSVNFQQNTILPLAGLCSDFRRGLN